MLDKKLSKEVNKKEQSGKARFFDEEDEETYTYDVKKPMKFINEGLGDVFDVRKMSGINTEQSVFDKGAVFHHN